MKLIIEDTRNGYIVKERVEDDDGKHHYEKDVIEEIVDERETLKVLLEMVAERFGIFHDKYKSDNLNITFDKKGYKVE